MKQPAWASMPVLDVRSLKSGELSKLAKVYSQIKNESLSPIAQLNADDVRIQIDNALANTLGFGDLSSIRELLAREPGLTGKEIAPRSAQYDLDLETDSVNEDQLRFSL